MYISAGYGSYGCKLACKEIEYQVLSDQAVWPHESSHVNFYYHNIYLEVPDYERFDVYDNITEYYELLETDLIRRNFLQINVNMAKPGYTVVTDTQQWTFVSLAGSLGGILNLWIGITFVTFVEVCDLVYQLIAHAIRRCKTKKDRVHALK